MPKWNEAKIFIYKKQSEEIPWWSSDLDPAVTAEHPDSTPGWGIKIPQAIQCGQKKSENVYFQSPNQIKNAMMS